MSSTMSTKDLTGEVKKHTRGVLLSKIGGVLLVKFERDYRELVGKRFPFRELGFSDSRSCLESLTDTVRFEYSEALQEMMLFGIADDHSFMSSPAIKAQFTPDKPVIKRQRNNKKNSKKSSGSDDSNSKSKAFYTREKQSQPVNGGPNSTNAQESGMVQLRPNLKGLYTICVVNLPRELETGVLELFSELASPEESSRGGSHFFLRYKTYEEAEDIIGKFDEYKLNGTTLKVTPAKEKMAPREGAQPRSSKVSECRPNYKQQSQQQGQSPQLEQCDSNSVITNGRKGKACIREPHQTGNASRRHDRPRSAPRKEKSRKSPRAGGDAKQDSQTRDDVPVRLPWQDAQPNRDTIGVQEHETDASVEDMQQQFETLAASQSVEHAASPGRTESVTEICHRSIPKPRLPSILDLADRFKGSKGVK